MRRVKEGVEVLDTPYWAPILGRSWSHYKNKENLKKKLKKEDKQVCK